MTAPLDRKSGTVALTLGAVIDKLMEVELPPTRRRDLVSAVRRVAKLGGLSPEEMPLEVEVLKEAIEANPPGGRPLSHKSRQNLRSDLHAAIAASGLKPVTRTSLTPLSPEWKALLDACRGMPVRIGLSSFGRFCSGLGISPADVSDELVERFLDARRKGTLKPTKAQREARRAIPRLWNMVREQLPDLGLPELIVPDRRPRSRYRASLEALPGTFREDLERFLAWCAVPDPFADGARPHVLREPTIILRRRHILSALTAAVDKGVPPERLADLGALVEEDVFKAILSHLHDKAGKRANAGVHAIATTLVSMAREWVKVGPEKLDRLKLLRSRLPRLPRGLVDKNQKLLRRFEDPETEARFVNLPHAIWREARSSRRCDIHMLVKAQVAIAVYLQMTLPMRPKNLLSLSLLRHFHEPAGAKGVMIVVIPPEETKTSEPITFRVPEELARWIREFRDRIYPAIASGKPDKLFARPDGVRKQASTFASQARKLIRRHLGFTVSIHQFRHVGGMLILKADPTALELVRQLLGHRSHKYSVNYVGIGTGRAGEILSGLVADLRANGKGAGGAPRRRK